MKNYKTMILVALCVVLSVCVGVMGTIAYLTDSETITNTMTVGNIAITLDEAKVNQYGQKLNAEGAIYSDGDIAAERVTSNDYKLIPGHTYTKDPIVTVKAGSEDCFLFVKVENGIADIETDHDSIANQIVANGWTQLDGVDGVYYKKQEAVDADTEVKVFEKFTIKDEIGGTHLANYKDKTIVITAYAVQADGFNDAESAWVATYGAPNS